MDQNNNLNQSINQQSQPQEIPQVNTQQQTYTDVSNNGKNNGNKNTKFYIIGIGIFVIAFVLGLTLEKVIFSKKATTNNNANNNVNNVDESKDYPTINNPTKTDTVEEPISGDENGDFLLIIEDVFTITGRGTVATGKVLRGTVNVGDVVSIMGINHETQTIEIGAIEAFRKNIDSATAGNEVGLLLKNVDADEVERGQVIAKPNSIKTYKKFDATIHVLSEEEAGKILSISDKDQPQFYFWATDISGTINLHDNIKLVNSGQDADATIELTADFAMEVGTKFYIRNGARTIAKGTVTKLY